jgi:hypothetical protein
MGLSHSPSIVTDSLALSIDIANIRSYPGTGTSIFNVFTSGIGGTFTSGISYSSSNSGVLVLNGTSQYIEILNSESYSYSSSSFSINLISKSHYTGTFFTFLSSRQLTGTNQGILITTDFQAGRERYLRYQLNTSGASNQFNSGTLIYDHNKYNLITMVVNRSDNTLKSYLNGNFDQSYSISGLGSFSSNRNIEIFRDAAFLPDSKAWAGGNVSLFQLYTKALTPSEILQNYNATKGRFGLS